MNVLTARLFQPVAITVAGALLALITLAISIAIAIVIVSGEGTHLLALGEALPFRWA